jgi:hypothetical protein
MNRVQEFNLKLKKQRQENRVIMAKNREAKLAARRSMGYGQRMEEFGKRAQHGGWQMTKAVWGFFFALFFLFVFGLILVSLAQNL